MLQDRPFQWDEVIPFGKTLSPQRIGIRQGWSVAAPDHGIDILDLNANASSKMNDRNSAFEDHSADRRFLQREPRCSFSYRHKWFHVAPPCDDRQILLTDLFTPAARHPAERSRQRARLRLMNGL